MVRRSRRLGIRIAAAAVLLVGIIWIVVPNVITDYLDPCAQEFIAAVGSARDVTGRYPANLSEVKSHLEMETQASCSIQLVEAGKYLVEWQQPQREVCRLVVAYRVDAAGNLEEYNVHRIAHKPD